MLAAMSRRVTIGLDFDPMRLMDDKKPVPDPESQHSDADDTSFTPDMSADPVEKEKKRTEGFGPNRPDLA
jgi:hypothetical protein